MEALVFQIFLVFRIGRGGGAFQHLRGVVVLQVQLVRAGCGLALVDELAKIVPGRVHFILASFFVRCRCCFEPFDLLTRGVGGLFVVLGRGGVVLERERGQGFLLGRRGPDGLQFDVLRPDRDLLIHLVVGESRGLGKIGQGRGQVLLLALPLASHGL